MSTRLENDIRWADASSRIEIDDHDPFGPGTEVFFDSVIVDVACVLGLCDGTDVDCDCHAMPENDSSISTTTSEAA